MMKTRLTAIMLFTILAIGGCGQKGDLYRTAEIPPPHMEQAEEKQH